jgi:putative hydrolase of the HAD superfamily
MDNRLRDHRRALLIDLDGVLRVWDADEVARAEAAAGLPAGAVARAAFAPDLLLPALTGRVSDDQWRAAVVARLQRDHPAADATLAVRRWSAPAGQVDPIVLDLVRACRPRARVVLVTNATTRLPGDLDRLGLTAELDAIVSSAVVGAAKPDPAIYRAALRAAGVDAARACFVDDSAVNVAAAEALGISGHQYRDPAGLRDALTGWGLLTARS